MSLGSVGIGDATAAGGRATGGGPPDVAAVEALCGAPDSLPPTGSADAVGVALDTDLMWSGMPIRFGSDMKPPTSWLETTGARLFISSCGGFALLGV